MNRSISSVRHAVVLLTLLLAACGGGGGGAPASPVATNNIPRFAYVANLDNTVSILAVDAASGMLHHNGYVMAGTKPWAVAVDPTGRFVYVANSGSSNVSAYGINASTGALTPVAGSPFAAGSIPNAVTVDPLGRFVYVVNNSQGSVSAYTLDAGTGALAPIDCGGGAGCNGANFVTAGVQPSGIAVDSAGKFVYVTNEGSSNVSAFAISATTGALTAVTGSPFAAGPLPRSVALDPAGKFAYVANNGGSVSAYTVNSSTGALSPVAGSPFATGAGGLYAVAVDVTGRFVYAANGGATQETFAFSINATTGALTPLTSSPFVGTGFPDGVIADPSGKFLYTTNTESGNISIFGIDAATGVLTGIGTIAARSAPFAIAMTKGSAPVHYTPKFAYVVNTDTNLSSPSTVSQYTIGDNGALAPMTPATVAAGVWSTAVAVDPSGRYAYVVNNANGFVSQYTIGPDGALTPMAVAMVYSGDYAYAVTVDPSGRYAYVTNMGLGTSPGSVSQYTIGADGSLTAMATAAVAAGIVPQSITVDPTGRFAYVANADNTVSQYVISANGTLTPLTPATVATGTGPTSVAVDPTGRFVYVTNRGDGATPGTVSQYSIGWNGALMPMTPATIAAGIYPASVTVDPAGRYAYVANRTGGGVSRYTLGADGALTPTTPATAAAAAGPTSVTVDLSGRYAYAPNGAGSVYQYTIGADGVFTPMAPASVAAGPFPAWIVTSGSYQ